MPRSPFLANHNPKKFFDDITTRGNNGLECPDLYVTGFTCQPFSKAGLGNGFKDENNGHIFLHIRDYIKQVLPKVFMIENVASICHHNNGGTLSTILETLDELDAYNVYQKVMNTEDHGIPHHRERLYICGIRRELDKGTFKWPDKIECNKLSTFLDTRDQYTVCTGIPKPTAETAGKHVRNFLIPLIKSGMDPLNRDFVITCDSHQSRSKCWYDRVPCMTKGQAQGMWISSRGRRMNKEEMMRIQGMIPSEFALDVSLPELGKQIGNSMSLNVVERILWSLLPAAGLGENECEDRWANGKAIEEIQASIDQSFNNPKGNADKSTINDNGPEPTSTSPVQDHEFHWYVNTPIHRFFKDPGGYLSLEKSASLPGNAKGVFCFRFAFIRDTNNSPISVPADISIGSFERLITRAMASPVVSFSNR